MIIKSEQTNHAHGVLNSISVVRYADIPVFASVAHGRVCEVCFIR